MGYCYPKEPQCKDAWMSQLKIDVIILPEAQNDILRFYHFYLETANKLVAADAVNTITD